MGKTVTIRMDDETYQAFAKQARQAHRPLGKYIEMAAYRYTMHSAFADTEEMNEITRDHGLVRRIRQGIAEAKKHRGRFAS